MAKSTKPDELKVGDLVAIEVWDHTHSYESTPREHCSPQLVYVVGWISRIEDRPVPHINLGNFRDAEGTQCDEYCLLRSAIKKIKQIT